MKISNLFSWKWKLVSQRLVWAGVVAVLQGVILSIIYFAGFGHGWQNSLSDMMFEKKDPRGEIVLLVIDDKSLNEIGRWPWDRSVHAKIVNFLTDAKASVVGYDVLFAEASTPSDDKVFKEALNKANNVILASEAKELTIGENSLSAKSLQLPIEDLQQTSSIGLVNVVASGDGVVRHMPFYVENEGKDVSSFWAMIAKQWYQARNDEEKFVETAGLVPLENGLLRINFAGPPGTYPQYSVIDVLEGRINPDVFTDKIVLVGSVSPSLHDDHLTPTRAELMPGLEVHANTIATFLGRDFIKPEPKLNSILTIFGFSILFNLLLVMLPIKWGMIVVVASSIGYLVFCLISFDGGVIRNLLFPPISILLAGVTSIVEKYFLVRRQRNYVRRAMGFYLSPSVMNEILSDPEKLKLGGQRREMSVLFLDIAGFTTLSEKLDPEILSSFLNDFLTRVSRIVYKHDGVVDKYMGDGMMAFWGAPIVQKDHAVRACKAALEMVKESEQIKRDWAEKNVDFSGVRVGINSGDMVVGNMGSDDRFDYSVIGDNVNVGARLEGLGKYYKVKLVVSEAVVNLVGDEASFRKLDTVAVKGKKEGLSIYELISVDELSNDDKEKFEEYRTARKLYEKGEFVRAAKLLTEFLVKYPEDGPAEVLKQRCELFAKRPPKKWDGVFKFEVK